MIAGLWRRLRATFRPGGTAADMDDELRYHFERDVERLVSRGVPLDEARATARKALGNAALTSQDMREAVEWRWLATLRRDTAYALRALRRAPGFAMAVVVTIAVALGLNTTVFTIFNAYALRPLAVHDPGSLYGVLVLGRTGQEPWTESWVDWGDYLDLAQGNPAFSEALAHRQINLRIEQSPAIGEMVSENFFRMLGVRMALGRGLVSDDGRFAGSGPVMVLSHRMWNSRYGADSGIVGRNISIAGHLFTVVGVAGPAFTGLTETPVDFWAPIGMVPLLTGDGTPRGPAIPPRAAVLGRLAPGVSAERAAEMVGARLRHGPGARRGDGEILGARLEPRPTTTPLSWELLLVFAPVAAAFVLILMIACANVANMMLARSLARQREIGIRLALGASRGQLVRQLLIESAVLALPAALLGLVMSRVTLDAGVRLMFAGFPPSLQAGLRIVSLSPDSRVFLFALAAALAAAMLFGLAPALQSTRLDPVRATRGDFDGGHPPLRLRNTLVIAQIAGCLLLLVVAGVLLRGSDRAGRMETGLRSRGVIQLEVNDAGRREVLAALQALPGISALAAASDPPAAGRLIPTGLSSVGDSVVEEVYVNRVSPEYFAILGMALLEGRGFSANEARGELSVAIVSETGAKRLAPDGHAVGSEVRLAADDAGLQAAGLRPFRTARVIGVVSDAMAGIVFSGRHAPIVYYPMSTAAEGGRILLRVPGEVNAAIQLVDKTVERAYPGALQGVYHLDQAIAAQIFPMRVASWIAGMLGIIALFLTLTGIYGVLSYMVGRRTREIGIRMALGAGPVGVVRLVIGQSLRLAVIGGAIGLTLALGVSAIFATQIPTVSTFDPVAYGGSAVLALLACLIAAWIPSRRAVRVDPLVALREE
jgi:predicted permease